MTFFTGMPPGSCTTWPETVLGICLAEGVACAAETPARSRQQKTTIARRISDWTQEAAQWFPRPFGQSVRNSLRETENPDFSHPGRRTLPVHAAVCNQR